MSTAYVHTALIARPAVPRLRAAGATDPGRQRSHNEDCFFCDADQGIFMVIDGVGGQAAGEVAAEMARDLISLRLRCRIGTAPDRLRRALATANKAIYHHGQTHAAQAGMACVLTAVLIEDGVVHVGHVGDTRLYEITRNGICKITRDHSLVGLREDRGELSELEAMIHPRRNEILRDLGSHWHAPHDDDFIDLYQFTYAPTAALLLCSDGLTDLVPSAVLHRTLLDHAGDPDATVQALLDLANAAGGSDNITVIVVEGAGFPAPPDPAPTPADPFFSLRPDEAAPLPTSLLLAGTGVFVLLLLMLLVWSDRLL